MVSHVFECLAHHFTLLVAIQLRNNDLIELANKNFLRRWKVAFLGQVTIALFGTVISPLANTKHPLESAHSRVERWEKITRIRQCVVKMLSGADEERGFRSFDCSRLHFYN